EDISSHKKKPAPNPWGPRQADFACWGELALAWTNWWSVKPSDKTLCVSRLGCRRGRRLPRHVHEIKDSFLTVSDVGLRSITGCQRCEIVSLFDELQDRCIVRCFVVNRVFFHKRRSNENRNAKARVIKDHASSAVRIIRIAHREAVLAGYLEIAVRAVVD